MESSGEYIVEHSIPTDILNDLCSRFIINMPREDRDNLVRICFQIEQAHWFYLDYYCTDETEQLYPCGIRKFAAHIFQHVPELRHHFSSLDEVLDNWREYKQMVPTYGAILLDTDLTHVLLVRSFFTKTSWGFPKGKVNQDEEPWKCAAREVLEETGFDISHLIDKDDYIETVIQEQIVRLYIISNIPQNTKFKPLTRNEIKACEWFALADLPANKKDMTPRLKIGVSPNAFFRVLPFVKRMKRWVAERNTNLLTNTKRVRYKSGDIEPWTVKNTYTPVSQGLQNEIQEYQQQNNCFRKPIKHHGNWHANNAFNNVNSKYHANNKNNYVNYYGSHRGNDQNNGPGTAHCNTFGNSQCSNHGKNQWNNHGHSHNNGNSYSHNRSNDHNYNHGYSHSYNNDNSHSYNHGGKHSHGNTHKYNHGNSHSYNHDTSHTHSYGNGPRYTHGNRPSINQNNGDLYTQDNGQFNNGLFYNQGNGYFNNQGTGHNNNPNSGQINQNSGRFNHNSGHINHNNGYLDNHHNYGNNNHAQINTHNHGHGVDHHDHGHINQNRSHSKNWGGSHTNNYANNDINTHNHGNNNRAQINTNNHGHGVDHHDHGHINQNRSNSKNRGGSHTNIYANNDINKQAKNHKTNYADCHLIANSYVNNHLIATTYANRHINNNGNNHWNVQDNNQESTVKLTLNLEDKEKNNTNRQLFTTEDTKPDDFPPVREDLEPDKETPFEIDLSTFVAPSWADFKFDMQALRDCLD